MMCAIKLLNCRLCIVITSKISEQIISDGLSNFSQKMHTFLQGCCFVPRENDSISTPSFLELSPHSIPSSRPSTRSGYDLRSLRSKEVFYIKRFPRDAWSDFDEERSCSSLRVLSGRTNSTESQQRKKDHSGQFLFMFPEEQERMSYWLCGTNAEESTENCYYVPTRKLKHRRRMMSSANRVLDFISMCFWRCSPGCQQIPTIA